LENAGAHIR
jgi:hypothetical protein